MEIKLKGFGARLKELRERLGLNLQSFAQLGGVNRVTQSRYESEGNYPGIDYLHFLSQNGVDIRYVLTEIHEEDTANIESMEMLGQALAWVDGLSKKHNYKLTPTQRARASVRLYREMVLFQRTKAPSLPELMKITDD